MHPQVSFKKYCKKSWTLTLLLPLLGLLVHCGTGGVKNPAAKPPAGFTPPTQTVLTTIGENWAGAFSPDGKRIVYLSKARLKHNQAQVYEMRLSDKKEQRLTFQDGEIFDAVYGRFGQDVYYSSTTDEIKELPSIIGEALKKVSRRPIGTEPFFSVWGEDLPTTEIYRSLVDGQEIERLTESHGFDGDITVRPNRNEIYFISIRGGALELFALGGGQVRHIPLPKEAVSRTTGSVFSPVFSPKGERLYFVLRNDTRKESQIVAWTPETKKYFVLVTLPARIDDLSVSPLNDEIAFATNYQMDDNSGLYAIHPDGSCLRPLVYKPNKHRFPQISPDGNKLLYTSRESGKVQLSIMDFRPPPCPPTPTPIQSGI